MRALTRFTTRHHASWAPQPSVKRLELVFLQGFTFCNPTARVAHRDELVFQYARVRDQLSPAQGFLHDESTLLSPVPEEFLPNTARASNTLSLAVRVLNAEAAVGMLTLGSSRLTAQGVRL